MKNIACEGESDRKNVRVNKNERICEITFDNMFVGLLNSKDDCT